MTPLTQKNFAMGAYGCSSRWTGGSKHDHQPATEKHVKDTSPLTDGMQLQDKVHGDRNRDTDGRRELKSCIVSGS